ncbi:MAG: TonB-dependent receptor [Bryobacteraceae bacterium]|nr:TonB-dependent receptor [Bryobacteraceae bacterium]
MLRLRLCFALLTSSMLFAQSERGNITGLVTDPGGAAIAAATLTVINLSTNATTTASSTGSGDYNVPNLLPGTYRVEIVAPGFKKNVQTNVVVAAASSIRVDVQLQLGQVTETVEVQAVAQVIQTDNAKVSTQVQNKLVDELPLVVGGAMRSPFNLVQVAAEAKGDGQRLAIGGGQASAWDATLDGHSVGTNRSSDTAEAALNTPSVEALTEFTVDTNGFKAEYGQAGGGVMTFASKSGTNQIHGSAYDFLRNDAMDARGFFARTRSVYRQNDYGFTVGGPVVLPKIYDGRNKSFFFVSFEGFRNRVGANATIFNVPTPEMFQGDFSNWVDTNNRLIPIYDPETIRANPNGSGFVRDQFPGNRIPANRFSSVARSILGFAGDLRPNRGGVPGTSAYVRQNYIVTGGSLVTPTDKWSVKGDQMLGSRHRLSYLWNMTTFRNEPGPGGPPGLPGPLWNGQIQDWGTDANRITHDYTITATLVNHASYFWNAFTKNSFSGATGGNWRDKVCIRNVVDCNVNFPSLNFTEFSPWNSTAFNGTDQPGKSFKNDLSWIRGSHTYKFGLTWMEQNANGFGQQDISGRADFSYLNTGVPGNTAFPASGGNSFASFLIGDTFLGRTETIRYVNQKFPYFGFYAQDDWRATRKLTINYGLRYEFTLPPRSGLDEYSDLNPTRPNPGANNYPGALWFAGFGDGRENKRSLVPGWYGAWGPRLGFAYQLDPKSTIRVGAGRSFSRVTAVQGSGHFAGFIGQYVFNNADQGITPTFQLDRGLPPYTLPPSLDPAFSNGNDVDFWQGQEATRAPENLFWSISVQREVLTNTVVEAAYNANVGTHLQTRQINLNQVPTETYNRLVQQYGPDQALSLLRADINSAQARAANIPIPYPNFATQRLRTVAQALRPFPQYQNINTGEQNGDKSGHSSYHALVLKLDRRFASGLTFNWNYVFSKVLTDSDNYFANTVTAAQDHYNRGLEKSIGAFDQTHVIKVSTLWEMPFGKGKRWLSKGFSSYVLGGWRVSAIQIYSSGNPIALTRNNPLPIFNAQTRPVIDSYDNWQAPLQGDKFDPAVDRFYKPASQFPAQPNFAFGNATRYNPKLRGFWNQNENVSVAKTFTLRENLRIDLRGEAFNLLNRTVFGTGNSNLNSNDFGVVTNQVNTPRQMQVALKLYW